MKYLVLEVDVFGIPLREENEPPKSSWPVKLSKSLEEEVMEWNKQFSLIIAAEHRYSVEERLSKTNILNAEGKHLADRIAEEIGDGTKVRFQPETV